MVFFLARHKRHVLTERELEVMKNTTPLLRSGGPHLFRTLKDKGENYCYF